jgi:hypothetical protein
MVRHPRKDAPMMTSKPVQILSPDGRTEVREVPPTCAAMRQLVGGPITCANILERIEEGCAVETYLYVNEEGLDLDLPYNQAASALCQHAVPLADDEQALYGIALYFEGWTCAEVDAYYQGDNS